jgi:hypothetical protein
MSARMTEGTRAFVVNISIILGLVWCYLKGYPLLVIFGSGLFLLVFANILMYLRRKRLGIPN